EENGIRVFLGNAANADSISFDWETSDYCKIQPSDNDFNNDGVADLVAHDQNSLLTLLKATVDTSTSVERNDLGLPGKYTLSQNYPNPFNPVTSITYQIPKASKVVLAIYDIQGRLVETLVDANQTAGVKTIKWDASGYASGVYVYKLKAVDFTDVKKLILLK
ncbi:T9SS type A sorting domain-containing protein, partial [candidate division KSB1 bacterium]|nr:T9SS type A sorting domain-containing protein [candidate division KSB1 bacterium]